MANIIQIKRSDTTAVPANGVLLTAELAYSYEGSSNSLFIGDNNANAELVTAYRIGGVKYEWLHNANTSAPGTLTSNSVVITNGNSYINEIRTNTLTLGADGLGLSANLLVTTANQTHLGTASNNELASTYAIKTYVDSSVSYLVGSGISNSQVAFSNGSAIVGVNAFVIDANSTYANVVIGGQDTGELYVGNTTGASIILTHNDAEYSIIAPKGAEFSGYVHVHADGTTGTGVTLTNETFVASGDANSEAQIAIQNINAGANASSDFAAYSNDPTSDDNGFINMGINSNNYTDAVYDVTGEGEGYLLMSATSGAGKSGDLVIATDDTGTRNDVRIHTGGFTNADAWAVRVSGNNDIGISKALYVGNSTVSGLIKVTGTANVTGTIGVGGIASFSANVLVGDNVNVTNGVNATTITVDDANVNGNTVIGSDAGDVVTFNAYVNSDVIPATDASNALGGASYQWSAVYTVDAEISGNANVGGVLTVGGNTSLQKVTANDITTTGDLIVGGDLTVQGTLTTIESETLTITDPMIKVANGNATTDAVDVGFYGTFGNSSVTQFAGLVRDSSDGGVFKLFTGAIPEPTTTVATGDANFSLAALYVEHLQSNTANVATFNVTTLNIGTSGVISDASPLTVDYGGTGLQEVSSGGILYGQGSGNTTLGVTSIGANGTVLQVVGNIPQFGTLDGGTF